MSDNTNSLLASGISFKIAGRRFHISRFAFLLILGAVVGAVTGGVTVVFRLAALKGEEWFFPYHGVASATDPQWWAMLRRLLMPAAGGLICGLLLFRIGRFEGSHSIPAILREVASGQNYFKARMAVPPALAIVTLATGGSVGPEGPIAEIGSVTGSQIGRWCRIPPHLIKPLIGSGVAAGISAVFGAPIAGIFFAIEVILRNYQIASFTPIAVASVVASVISQAALGDQTALTLPEVTTSMSELPLFALLGLICGFISIAYIHGLGRCHDLFARLRTPLWTRPMIGGLAVGLIGVFFPNIMGEGYEWMDQVLEPSRMHEHYEGLSEALGGTGGAWVHAVLFLCLLFVLKIIATGCTLGSGNPGGSFAPAIFIGVMAGAAFGILMGRTFGIENAAPYAIMGMAGLNAGALGAPITAIMITLRQGSGSSEILLPVLTTVALSMFVMQWGRGVTVYTLGFLRLGIDLDRASARDPLSLMQVRSFMHTEGFDELPAAMPVHAALDRCKGVASRWFVVRDEVKGFCGIVSLHEMRVAIADHALGNLLLLNDITDAFLPRLHTEMSLKEALASFTSTEAEVLPVFESTAPVKSTGAHRCGTAAPGGQTKAEAMFVGVLSRQDALNAYSQSTQIQ